MNESHEFFSSLAIVFAVAAVTSVICHRLRLPIIFGYILAGLVVGPHIPVPLIADPGVIRTLAELGIIMLLFSLGLEFSIRKLVRVGPTAGFIAVVQCSIMFLLGLAAGQALGWTTLEGIFAGAMIAISSTAIIAKTFADKGLKNSRLSDLVIGILIFEDIIAILLLVLLTALGHQGGVSGASVFQTAAGLLLFVTVALVGGILTLPRLIRWLKPAQNPELAVVVAVGICFSFSFAAYSLGYSVALGAFLGGAVLAESGHAKILHKQMLPIHDMFAAVFFVSVGMLFDPAIVLQHAWAVVLFLLLTWGGKFLAVSSGALLVGTDTKTSIRAGLSLAQIGEFSFIIAALGESTGATGKVLFPVAVAVSAITTLTTPLLIEHSDSLANRVDRHLPPRLQTFLTLYSSWLSRGKNNQGTRQERARIRRLGSILGIDLVVMMLLAISLGVWFTELQVFLINGTGVSVLMAQFIMGVIFLVLLTPFAIGVYRSAYAIAGEIAGRIMPSHSEGSLNLMAAPQKALVVAIQTALILISGVLVSAVISPFLPLWEVGVMLGFIVLLNFTLLWRTAGNLHGHVQATSQVILEKLSEQSSLKDEETQTQGPRNRVMDELIAGLGNVSIVPILADDYAVGRSLGQLNLRGCSNSSVVAIKRDGTGIAAPTAATVILAGDRLALAGTEEALATAARLLRNGSQRSPIVSPVSVEEDESGD